MPEASLVRDRDRDGVSVRLFHFFRLDNFMSLSLVGKSRIAQRGWDIPYFTSPDVPSLPECSPGLSHMLTVIHNPANPPRGLQSLPGSDPELDVRLMSKELK